MLVPSAPFVLLIVAGVVGLTILTLGVVGDLHVWHRVGRFAVLLPIVNRLDRRGVNRGLASLLAVAITVAIVIGIALAGIAIFFREILPFIAAIPATLANIQAEAPPALASAIGALLDAINSASQGVDQGTVVLGFLKGALGMLGTALSWTSCPCSSSSTCSSTSRRWPAASWRDPCPVASCGRRGDQHLPQRLVELFQGGDHRWVDPGHDRLYRHIHHRSDRRTALPGLCAFPGAAGRRNGVVATRSGRSFR